MKQSPRSHHLYPVERHAILQDPSEIDEIDFLGSTLPTSSSSRSRPAPSTTSIVQSKKRKTAQSIQTPSASPRHQPLPVASTSNHQFTREDKNDDDDARRRRRIELEQSIKQRDLERSQRAQEEVERERNNRKRLSLSSRLIPERMNPSPRQERSIRRSLEKGKAREEEEVEVSEPKLRRRSENRERVGYDDGRIFKNGQLVRPSGSTSKRRIEEEEAEAEGEEPLVKWEESLEDSDLECVIVKDEEEALHQRSSLENGAEDKEERMTTEREQFALKQLGLEKQRLLRHEPLIGPSRSTPPQTLPRSQPRPQSQSSPSIDSPPSLASFLTSLDLPRLSRLIPHFHSIGVESPEELYALSSQTAAGKRRRDNVMSMIEDAEKGLGREFKRFERETVEGELDEARKGWVLRE